ncbi:hypothetical protein [Brachybacterium sp. Marseille-Q7125]|uniref:hypothetical protein n=1 Tax=Brachybacterium sp. Marseille-Q7125 TaxID=2932815 RepID=UPI001FF2B436|nr:hypothetical protein [Brachybacterium sp. Marseille-Q7125]
MAQILLIEDSPEVHALVEETLRAEGHQVRGARDKARFSPGALGRLVRLAADGTAGPAGLRGAVGLRGQAAGPCPVA